MRETIEGTLSIQATQVDWGTPGHTSVADIAHKADGCVGSSFLYKPKLTWVGQEVTAGIQNVELQNFREGDGDSDWAIILRLARIQVGFLKNWRDQSIIEAVR